MKEADDGQVSVISVGSQGPGAAGREDGCDAAFLLHLHGVVKWSSNQDSMEGSEEAHPQAE